MTGSRQGYESDAMWEAREDGRPFTPQLDGFDSDLVTEQLRRAFWIAGAGRGESGVRNDEPERTDFALYAAEKTQSLLCRPGYEYRQMGTGYGWITAQCRYRRKEWRKTLPPELDSWNRMSKLSKDKATHPKYHSIGFTPDQQDETQMAGAARRLADITNTFPSRRLKTWNKFQERGLQHFAFGQSGDASSLRALAKELDMKEQTCRDLVEDVRKWYAPVHEGNIVAPKAEPVAPTEDEHDYSQMTEGGGILISISAGADCRYLTCTETAKYLGGLNARTVARWAREGYLPSIPLGEGKKRLWRFMEADLDAWMEARKRGGQLAA